MGCVGTNVEEIGVEELEVSCSGVVEGAVEGDGERHDVKSVFTVADVEGILEVSVGGRDNTTSVGGEVEHGGREGGSLNGNVLSSKTASVAIKILPVRGQ